MKLWVYAFSKSQISNMCNSAFINKVSLKFPNFREAKKLGNQLHVGLNSDEWLTNKRCIEQRRKMT